MPDFASLLDAPLFDTFGVAGTYTPQGGEAMSVVFLVSKGTAADRLGRLKLSAQTVELQVRVADVAAPAAGDAVTVEGETYTVRNAPERDALGTLWTLHLGP